MMMMMKNSFKLAVVQPRVLMRCKQSNVLAKELAYRLGMNGRAYKFQECFVNVTSSTPATWNFIKHKTFRDNVPPQVNPLSFLYQSAQLVLILYKQLNIVYKEKKKSKTLVL